MRWLMFALLFCASTGLAHNSYTGGYSGAPGRLTCALSCHGGSSGTLAVSGFPTAYTPQQTYRIVIRHNGGALIVNFNATTRVGSTSTVAGTFTTVTNTALYNGADGGVYATPHAIDSAVFQWTAPASGTGLVNFYAAGFQGSTSSSNGQSRAITLSATEITTGVNDEASAPGEFELGQNYPNPFNPSTTIHYQLPYTTPVVLKVYDIAGKEVATLVSEVQQAGAHNVRFPAGGLASGVYLYRFDAGTFSTMKKMLLLR